MAGYNNKVFRKEPLLNYVGGEGNMEGENLKFPNKSSLRFSQYLPWDKLVSWAGAAGENPRAVVRINSTSVKFSLTNQNVIKCPWNGVMRCHVWDVELGTVSKEEDTVTRVLLATAELDELGYINTSIGEIRNKKWQSQSRLGVSFLVFRMYQYSKIEPPLHLWYTDSVIHFSLGQQLRQTSSPTKLKSRSNLSWERDLQSAEGEALR